MHTLFAVSAVALLASTLLMMYKDENREWREYQRRAEELRIERIESELAKYDDEKYEQQVAELEERLGAAEVELEEKSSELAELNEQANELQGQIAILSRSSKATNAERDKARADYDIAVRDERPQSVLDRLKLEFDRLQESAVAKARELQLANAEYDAIKSKLATLREGVDEATAALATVVAEQQALQEQKELIEPSSSFVAAKRAFKQWPIINGFNPVHKIQYDWASGLTVQLGMTEVSRVDRCRSCHVNIAQFGAGNVPVYSEEDYEQPFCSHPHGDLYLTAASPHPVQKFGCTVCHDGDGSGTSFQTAEHSPEDPIVAEHWEEEYGWHSNHFWEYPMLPDRFIESGCIKCHHNVVELGINPEFGASAPKVYEGYSLVRQYGCFGCHEINGYDGSTPIGPDLRLEPETEEDRLAIAEDPNQVAGKMRKVGPSLKYVASKLTPEFVAYWTEEPKRFRPTTRMPQFFNLTNQHDAAAELLQPMELAGIARYLEEKSVEFDALTPKEGYEPNAERGKHLFSRKGCLACHNHQDDAFEGIDQTFGPDLTKVHAKIKPGPEGFNWLYTWLKQPSKYHARTRMPNLYLDPEGEGENYVDPAADIAAFLLEGGPEEFPALPEAETYIGVSLDENFTEAEAQALRIAEFAGVRVEEVVPASPAERATLSGSEGVVSSLLLDDVITSVNGQAVTSVEQFRELESALTSGDAVQLTVQRGPRVIELETKASTPLEDLARYYLLKAMSADRVEEVFANRRVSVSPSVADAVRENPDALSQYIKGDEIELVSLDEEAEISAEEWEQRLSVYIGRRTISRYGCYGCHEIPGFEGARPIGVALQDWGRKDTSKLAPEHIEEFLHHHGEPDGSSTRERVATAIKLKKAGSDVAAEDLDAAFFYESLLHHGRPGFIWQKLRQPRSYDYRKTETKGWDERLKMPKFPFNEQQIEAIATFVLGLVADPPAPEFQYRPDGSDGARIEGERLLTKYNCTGCHMLELPEIEFAVDPEELFIAGVTPSDHEPAVELLKKLKPPRDALTGKKTADGEAIMRFHGLVRMEPDPEEDPEFQIYSYSLWETLELEDELMLPGQPLQVPVQKIVSRDDGRGGEFATWLVPRLAENETKGDRDKAWQSSPPPLYLEGPKVQTPWLYQFLKNPEPIRYTTVLRMPRFNMDPEEAQALANYFAAVDKEPYPYQLIPPQQPSVQEEKQDEFVANYPDASGSYLHESWKVLNGQLCIKCHAVGGRPYVGSNPATDIRGPNLDRVEERLRPEWVQLWIYNPKWITPYTSMPSNFPADKVTIPDLFGGNGTRQAEAVVDALFNYRRLMEIHGQFAQAPAEPAAETAPAEGAE